MLGTDLGKILRDLFPWQPSRCCDNQKKRLILGFMMDNAQLPVTLVGNLIFEYLFKPCDSVATPLTRPSERVRHLGKLYSRTLAKDHLDQETTLLLRPLFTSPN